MESWIVNNKKISSVGFVILTLLVYTPKITLRLKFVFKHICTRILNIPVSFTNVIEEFIAHDQLKMSYGSQPLGSEFFVRSNGLLLEQGLSDL